jgi:signal transduction histidine kinase
MTERTVTGVPIRLSTSTFSSDLRAILLLAVAYYVGCLLGFITRFPSSGIAYIWPPTAILVVGLVLSKPSLWPMILGATLVTHGIAHHQDDLPVATWLWQFLGNGTQAVIGASVVLLFCERSSCFDTPRGVTGFVLGAAIAAPAIASVLPAPFYVQMGWAADFWSAWGMRTLTNAVTTITLVPPLLAIFTPERRVFRNVTAIRTAEFAVLLLGLMLVDLAAWPPLNDSHWGVPPALYAGMPFFIWAAVRFGVPGLSVALLAAVCLTVHAAGVHLPPDMSATVAIVSIQMFVVIAGSPLMFLSVVREESRQVRRTEKALHHSEAKNAAILRALPDLMFVLSRDSDHRYLDAYARDTGDLLVSPEQFLGRRMRDVLPGDLARSFEELIERAEASGEAQMVEYSLPIGGIERSFEARVVVCDDDRLVSIVRDITERKRADAALRKARQALERMSRASALGELAAAIAHEVRQPLTAIATNAAACLRALDDSASDSQQLGAALTDIMEDSQRAAQVVRRTSDLFKGGSRENAPVNLNAAILEVLALTRQRAEPSSEAVQADLETDLLMVMGDRVQLQQVLLNLVLNGLESMRSVPGPNRTVIVRSRRHGRSVHIAVQDSGPGFDPIDAERMFQPFYTTKSEGLGIGLAISRSIIEAHHGRLTASLNPTHGATFEIVLPAMSAQYIDGPGIVQNAPMERTTVSRDLGV